MENKVNKDCRYISNDNHCNIMAQKVENCTGGYGHTGTK